jgi:hypothetical protein
MPRAAKVPAVPRPLDLSLAFPAALRPAAAALSADWDPHRDLYSYSVTFKGERLTIPSRVYFDLNLIWQAAGRSQLQQGIAWCLGTRHHNGYVREECLSQMLAAPQPWMAPFIVQLIGEYVLEIVQSIADALPGLAPAMQHALAGFVRDNPRYLNTIDSRTISYWRYYMQAYPERASYPGARAVAWLRALAAQAAG